MTRSAAPKLGAYAGLSALGLLAALALGRPELAVLAAPFAVAIAVAVPWARDPAIKAWVTVERDRMVEGGEVVVDVELESPVGAPRVELLLVLPDGMEAPDNPVARRLPPRGTREVAFKVTARRWGAYKLGDIAVRATDRFGFFVFEERLDHSRPVKVYPHPEVLRTMLRPLETQPFGGNQVARVKGDGIEFADLRPFVPGDRLRRINWRASARRSSLWVNESHPERNTDVVIFLDSFAEARAGELGTLDLAVRAAASIADRYLTHKDRVGLVSFGGVLNWLTPATGLTQLYRIVDSLLDTEIVLSYAWKDIEIVPRRTLPPQALIVGLTPLLDDRAVGALLDLRTRGFDLALIEVSPEPFTPAPSDSLGEFAHRLWRLRREALRDRFRTLGVPVSEWRAGVGLQAPIEEVRAYRRYARARR